MTILRSLSRPRPRDATSHELAAELARGLTDEALDCRIYGHQMRRLTAQELPGGEWEQTRRCVRCRTMRHDRQDRMGYRVGAPRYDYSETDGYLLKGTGPVGRDGNAALRLEERRRSVPATAPQRARRRTAKGD